MVGAILQRFGSAEVKREALARVAAGEAVCCLGFTEPGCGSDVFAAQTRATRDGDFWRIDGSKMFTSGANFAEYVLLLARTDPNVPKHKGLTMFLVEQNVPAALDLADRGYVLQTGRVVLEGTSAELRDSDLVRRAYLGI